MNKRSLFLIGLIISIGLLVIGCGKKEETINVVGSTSVSVVAEELGKEFSKSSPEVTVDVQGVGSTAGINSIIDGTADIGMSSRNLEEDEKNENINEHIIAYDGIVVAVNPKNSVKDLDIDSVKGIFSGEITNWKEVGGEDEEILVVSREEGSGTRGAFEEITGLEEKDDEGNEKSLVREDALIAEGNGAVLANVAGKENSIGYISLSYLDDSVKGLSIDGIEPTVENIKSEEYKISRPFLMLTKDDKNELANKFVEFVLSDEGQKIVGENQITVK